MSYHREDEELDRLPHSSAIYSLHDTPLTERMHEIVEFKVHIAKLWWWIFDGWRAKFAQMGGGL